MPTKKAMEAVELLNRLLSIMENSTGYEELTQTFIEMAEDPSLIRTNNNRLPFDITLGDNTDVTDVVIDSTAFGVLWRQSTPESWMHHQPAYRYPFGYESLADIKDEQNLKSSRLIFQSLEQAPHPVTLSPYEFCVGEFSVSESESAAVSTSTLFGWCVESATPELVAEYVDTSRKISTGGTSTKPRLMRI